ncbi:putative nucleotidyltransferase substrate binding domain-containing protein [Vibrio sp. TH_r3]|uniref:DUF294 nucleotidyltransferase-like domain-containing protein n=1 Tax=Vibrio sp. TH_r3 TaxID=3082084 RepID=UPI00295569CA|nr:DUF294 nucleotidyltransferase-like domain-containing protein [Vibrio sp. TH_r3]MDV7105489.1 putative nucleotidyltransferase substrate binding domain-containing protein [Vibrio sp. TH_r3]
MPDKFNMQSPPFDRLSENQQLLLRSSLDVAYYRAKDQLVTAGEKNKFLHILIKGVVEERSADDVEVFAHYANDDIFDVRSQFDHLSKHNYIALEDTLCYLLPNDKFLQLYHSNGEFAAYFDNSLSKRRQLIKAAQQQQNLAEFILTRVDRSIYHPPLIITAELPLTEATQLLKDNGVDAALVQLNEDDKRILDNSNERPYGIVTRTNMLHAVMLDKRPLNTAIGDIVTFPVFHVDDGDFLFNAMITMTKQKMKRVMVCDGNNAVGMLDMTQILSAFSTHSHVLTLSIARASSIDELALAANRQRHLVESLITNGIRTRFIMELISAVNEQIIEKAFELVLPPTVHNKVCLIVLGSEGRGEQILKTDQDNALIIKQGVDIADLSDLMNTLTHTLQQLGYPLCPGNVMVNNPQWVKHEKEWEKTLNLWISSSKPEQVMKLAIMADAHAVAGNTALLAPIKKHLIDKMTAQELILAEFTKPALSFSTPLTLFGNVKSSKQGLDIKSGGLFPIVHGVRALSLEYAIEENNTFDRLLALTNKKVLEKETADNLSEAFKLFVKLRLTQQLSQQHSHNIIDLKLLERTERDLLRHSFHVVKKFKQWLEYHYQIRD